MRWRALGNPAVTLAALALAACSPGSGSGKGVTLGPCPQSAARVAVSAQGLITLNGTEVSASSLAVALRSLSPPPALVCYHREAPTGNAPASSPAALEAIMSMRLPVLVFEDAGFAHGAAVK